MKHAEGDCGKARSSSRFAGRNFADLDEIAEFNRAQRRGNLAAIIWSPVHEARHPSKRIIWLKFAKALGSLARPIIQGRDVSSRDAGREYSSVIERKR